MSSQANAHLSKTRETIDLHCKVYKVYFDAVSLNHLYKCCVMIKIYTAMWKHFLNMAIVPVFANSYESAKLLLEQCLAFFNHVRTATLCIRS